MQFQRPQFQDNENSVAVNIGCIESRVRAALNVKNIEFTNKQAQKRPKVFGCAQIISLLNTEQNHLARLPTALPIRNVGRANVADPMRYLIRRQTRCVSH
jgi:hypothetical protein